MHRRHLTGNLFQRFGYGWEVRWVSSGGHVHDRLAGLVSSARMFFHTSDDAADFGQKVVDAMRDAPPSVWAGIGAVMVAIVVVFWLVTRRLIARGSRAGCRQRP